MKAIAFAIICAAYLLAPNDDFSKLSNGAKAMHGVTWLICIIGFWVCIVFEGWLL